MDVDALNFRGDGVIPAVAQDAATGEVLMLAYMNREALQRTLETGRAWYWSRSRQALWLKGETSGHHQLVREVLADCDGDAVLLRVEQIGPGACHTGYRSCFHHRLGPGESRPAPERTFDPAEVYGTRGGDVLAELFALIVERKRMPQEGSYTSYLFAQGLDKILKKIGEESTEVVIAAKNDEPAPLLNEAADLLYHLLVLLAERGLPPAEVLAVLRERRGRAAGPAER